MIKGLWSFLSIKIKFTSSLYFHPSLKIRLLILVRFLLIIKVIFIIVKSHFILQTGNFFFMCKYSCGFLLLRYFFFSGVTITY